jgi:hypothetical protein
MLDVLRCALGRHWMRASPGGDEPLTTPAATRPAPASSRSSARVPAEERTNGSSGPRAGLDKLVRIGVTAEMLLDEARRAPLDQAAMGRLRDVQEALRQELGDCLSPLLSAELDRLVRPVGGDPPSEGELRVVQAELVGWLEGLTSAVWSAMVAKSTAGGVSSAGSTPNR